MKLTYRLSLKLFAIPFLLFMSIGLSYADVIVFTGKVRSAYSQNNDFGTTTIGDNASVTMGLDFSDAITTHLDNATELTTISLNNQTSVFTDLISGFSITTQKLNAQRIWVSYSDGGAHIDTSYSTRVYSNNNMVITQTTTFFDLFGTQSAYTNATIPLNLNSFMENSRFGHLDIYSYQSVYTLDSPFGPINSLVGYNYYDKITMQQLSIAEPIAVPEPASVWLFGSGLGLLAVIYRRKLKITYDHVVTCKADSCKQSAMI
ncbi:MAG: PEP-CTERM sorting domain-containing protein [Methylococcaceae bacterium]